MDKGVRTILPMMLAKIPIRLTPPFVPRGTFFHEMMWIGSDLDTTEPISEDQVSPLQHAKISKRVIR